MKENKVKIVKNHSIFKKLIKNLFFKNVGNLKGQYCWSVQDKRRTSFLPVKTRPGSQFFLKEVAFCPVSVIDIKIFGGLDKLGFSHVNLESQFTKTHF